MKYNLSNEERKKIKSYFSGSKIENSQIETKTKEQAKPLFLVMQKVWFDEIECGNKKVEYRDDSDFYISRLCNKDKEGKIITRVSLGLKDQQ